MDAPFGLSVVADRSVLVSQPLAHRIIRISPDGTTTVVAGTGKAGHAGDGGPATAAELDSPAGLALAPDGTLFVADRFNDRIRRIRADGLIDTVPTGSPLRRPRAVAVDRAGVLYIADTDNHRVWRVTPDGTAEVVAGSGTPGYSGDGGPAIVASIGRPQALAVDGPGTLLIADPDARRIRRVDPSGRIETYAGLAYGGRPATGASLAPGTDVGTPAGLAVGPDGTVYVADPSQDRMLAVEPDGMVRVLAGPAGQVRLVDPRQVAVADDGTVHVAQPGQHRVTVVRP